MTNPNFYTSLSPSQKEIFDLYKSNYNQFCFRLNDSLRKQNAKEFTLETNILDTTITLNQNTEIVTLHRATNEANILPFINSNIYINPDFLSTSFDLDSAQYHFTNAVKPAYLLINCKIGTNMALLETNDIFSGTENEVLLGRNNRFIVLQNRLSEDRNEIEKIMGRDFAQGVNSLRIIETTNII